jgi:GTP cyclohydrolase IB
VAVAHQSLADVQAGGDLRNVALQEVGVSGVRLPGLVRLGDEGSQPTIFDADLTVEVPAHVRGTHMSRFLEASVGLSPVDPATVLGLARDLLGRLEAPASRVELRFPLFVDKAAPASGLVAPQGFDAHIRAIASSEVPGANEVWVGVRAAVTSLCPCSKEISDYGAHSQRGYVDVEVLDTAWSSGALGIDPFELYRLVASTGSAEIYPLLKRVDERRVTMDAYDNPAFVEDIAREVVVALRADGRAAAWAVAVTNQESIHDHQAVARTRGRR